MGRNIVVGDFLFDVLFVLIDQEEALLENRHLAQSHLGKVALFSKVSLEQVSQVVLGQFLQQIHKEQLQFFAQGINCLGGEGQDSLVGDFVDLVQRLQGQSCILESVIETDLLVLEHSRDVVYFVHVKEKLSLKLAFIQIGNLLRDLFDHSEVLVKN